MLCVITPAAIGPQYFRQTADVINAGPVVGRTELKWWRSCVATASRRLRLRIALRAWERDRKRLGIPVEIACQLYSNVPGLVFVLYPGIRSCWMTPNLSSIVIVNLIANLLLLYHKPSNTRICIDWPFGPLARRERVRSEKWFGKPIEATEPKRRPLRTVSCHQAWPMTRPSA